VLKAHVLTSTTTTQYLSVLADLDHIDRTPFIYASHVGANSLPRIGAPSLSHSLSKNEFNLRIAVAP
jgi:hypothetical protein